MLTFKAKESIDLFSLTRFSTNTEQIYDSLVLLRPDKLRTSEIVKLVQYIQINSYQGLRGIKHFNSFGTGGDKFKTINISTIASIIASHFIKIFKVGTKAVTSEWGSSDFISALYSFRKQLPSRLRQKAGYKNGSGYLSLSKLGHPYSDHLKKARIRLYQEDILDIYKVVFPVSNLTYSYGQVTGVSNYRYIQPILDTSIALGRNSLIVHSTQGVDELLPGKNLLVRISQNKFIEDELYLPIPKVDSGYLEFIAESTDINDHVRRFIEILKGDCSFEVTVTIAYNAACILNLCIPNLQIDSLAKDVLSFMTSDSIYHV